MEPKLIFWQELERLNQPVLNVKRNEEAISKEYQEDLQVSQYTDFENFK